MGVPHNEFRAPPLLEQPTGKLQAEPTHTKGFEVPVALLAPPAEISACSAILEYGWCTSLSASRPSGAVARCRSLRGPRARTPPGLLEVVSCVAGPARADLHVAEAANPRSFFFDSAWGVTCRSARLDGVMGARRHGPAFYLRTLARASIILC